MHRNLLVYPKSNEDKIILIDNQFLFSQCKSCDLELNKKKFQLMVKSIDANNFKLRYNTDVMQIYKIVNAIEIKKQDGQILKLCKIELEAREDFDNLLQEGSTQLGLFSYKVEQIARGPVRCHNCKEFGHSIKSCKNWTKCAKCGKKYT